MIDREGMGRDVQRALRAPLPVIGVDRGRLEEGTLGMFNFLYLIFLKSNPNI